jgi:hypothetical protein
MLKAKRITLEGNKNKNSIFSANDQAHLTNNDSYYKM